MGKRGMRFRDMLPNRHYEKVDWAAASTTAAYSTFDVVAGGVSPQMAWLIQKFDVMFQGIQAQPAAANQRRRYQLCTGAQTALLNVDDDNVVGTIDHWTSVLTDGGIECFEPFSWVGPVLVASRKLTAIQDAVTDAAPYQSTSTIFTIWYRWVEMDKDTWYEVQQAQGILT